MTRIALGLEYDGTAFHGWQRQSHARNVQSELERALSTIAATPLQVTGAGRTDAGVHACSQVAHFDSPASRPAHAWVLGANSVLSPDLAVLWARAVETDFDARYSARERRYRYVILNRRVRGALARNRVAWIHAELDAGLMSEAAGHLVGEHDFRAFRAAACQSRTTRRELRALEVRRRGDHVIVDAVANAFLHHMVRNIVGTLLCVGRGDAPPAWVGEVLASRDRTLAGPTAPAAGLYLVDIVYPDSFGLPRPDPSVWPPFGA